MDIGFYKGITNNFLLNIPKQLDLVSESLERLSTGNKINHAADDPAAILKISRLNTSIRGNKVAQDNIQSGITFLQVADNTLGRVGDLGLGLRDLALKYQSDTVLEDEREEIKKEAGALMDEIAYTFDHTKFNGEPFSDKDTIKLQTGPDQSDSFNIDMSGFNSLKDSVNELHDPPDLETQDNAKSLTSLNASSAQSHDTDDISSNGTQAELIVPPSEKNQKISDGWNEIYNGNNKKIYEGNISNGKFDGQGKWYDDEGRLIYEGNFDNGKYERSGKLYNSETGKLIYDGNFKENKYDGYGTLYNNDGSIAFQGTFKMGKIDDVNGCHGGTDDSNNPSDPGDDGTIPDNPGNDDETDIPSDDEDDTDEDDGDTTHITIEDLLNDTDKIDDLILKPAAELQSFMGFQQNILEGRLSYLQENDTIQKNYLSNIQDTDIAGELVNYIRSSMLKDINTSLLSQNLDDERNYIKTLLQ